VHMVRLVKDNGSLLTEASKENKPDREEMVWWIDFSNALSAFIIPSFFNLASASVELETICRGSVESVRLLKRSNKVEVNGESDEEVEAAERVARSTREVRSLAIREAKKTRRISRT